MSAIESIANTGHKIALVGVIVQAVAFCTFTGFLIYFGFRVKSLYPEKWHGGARQSSGSVLSIFSKQPIADWRILYWGMLVACIGFIVRSIFRAVEFSQVRPALVTLALPPSPLTRLVPFVDSGLRWLPRHHRVLLLRSRRAANLPLCAHLCRPLPAPLPREPASFP